MSEKKENIFNIKKQRINEVKEQNGQLQNKIDEAKNSIEQMKQLCIEMLQKKLNRTDTEAALELFFKNSDDE